MDSDVLDGIISQLDRNAERASNDPTQIRSGNTISSSVADLPALRIPAVESSSKYRQPNHEDKLSDISFINYPEAAPSHSTGGLLVARGGKLKNHTASAS